MRLISAHIECEATVDDIDLAALIRANLKEYRTVDVDGEEWGRPDVFLRELLANDLLFAAPGGRIGRAYEYDPDIDFRWSEKDYDELIAECPEAALEPIEPEDDRRPQPYDVPLPLEIPA